MARLAMWPEGARLAITLGLALCVAMQTLALVLSHYRHPRSRGRMLENMLELGVLVQIFLCVLVYGQAVLGFELGLVAPRAHVALHYAAFAANALLAAAVAATIKRPWPAGIVIASALTLPAVETASGSAFACVYLGAMLFWLLRGVHICMLRTREMNTNLSALSVKNAIDRLHSGVLFGEPDGFILLTNRQMQRLMEAATGKVHRNGWAFYGQLLAGDVQPGCRVAEFEGQIVCLLPSGAAWMFTKTELGIKRRRYIQLAASDITQQWRLTAQLQAQESLLNQRRDELNAAIANVHVLSRQREMQKAKMRAHDILGERLSLLLRAIRSEESLGRDVLQALSQGLLGDLQAGEVPSSPQDEFEGLQQAFASIGVQVEISGTWPAEAAKGSLFVDIIREGVTNAVRHGFATRISVAVGNDRLQIANNGHAPGGPVAEGGGLAGMRSRIEPYGGSLDVCTEQTFVLTVNLPGGKEHV